MKKSESIKILLNFLPLLVIYVIIILVFSSNELTGDESRHLNYTTNLANGFFTDTDNPSLRIGPLYPIVILVPTILNASHDFLKLLNAPFLFLAVVFFYKALRYYLNPRAAVVVAYIFGLYPPILRYISAIYTEALALLLICGFLYYFIRLYKDEEKSKTHLIITASFLGLLSLTKVIFAYVIIAAILFSLGLYIIKKTKEKRNILFVLIVGLLFSIPYLLYTYSVTDKALVWGTQGGEILYWRTTPFENEFGNWISIDDVLQSKTSGQYANTKLYENHGAFIQSLEPLSFLERDALFKEKAIQNIKEYPLKNLKNTGASALRLFFNYPYSYTPQKLSSFYHILPNMTLIVFLIFSLFLGIKNRKRISFEIIFLSLMSFIFIGGLTLLDGRVRHLVPIIPLLIFIISVLANQFVHIKFNGELHDSNTVNGVKD